VIAIKEGFATRLSHAARIFCPKWPNNPSKTWYPQTDQISEALRWPVVSSCIDIQKFNLMQHSPPFFITQNILVIQFVLAFSMRFPEFQRKAAVSQRFDHVPPSYSFR
jgi:hypothetical protein